ncbi:MAG: FAD:protein FMN transferase [Myxococcota bacterium]
MSEPKPLLSGRARWLVPVLLLVLLVVSVHRYQVAVTTLRVELGGEALGTTWSVKLAGELAPERQRSLQAALENALARVDAQMSTWRDDSELSRFNLLGADAPFVFSPEAFAVFAISEEVAVRSGGAFDVTVGPLVDAWGFGARPRRATAPEAEQLASLRRDVGRHWLRLDAVERSVEKRRAGVRVDLSAVAKGYAVDLLAQTVSERGHANFLVEIGGELRGAGERPGGGPWRVAIEEPREEGRQVHRIVALSDAAMATSGDYRNFFTDDAGRRFSHTIDPRTGSPIAHPLASVTVVHPSAAWADAWATALNVLGPEAGYARAESEGLAAYFLVREQDPEPGLGSDPGSADAHPTDGAFEARWTPAFEPLLLPDPRSGDDS